jgi:hypothetical protein
MDIRKGTSEIQRIVRLMAFFRDKGNLTMMQVCDRALDKDKEALEICERAWDDFHEELS